MLLDSGQKTLKTAISAKKRLSPLCHLRFLEQKLLKTTTRKVFFVSCVFCAAWPPNSLVFRHLPGVCSPFSTRKNLEFQPASLLPQCHRTGLLKKPLQARDSVQEANSNMRGEIKGHAGAAAGICARPQSLQSFRTEARDISMSYFFAELHKFRTPRGEPKKNGTRLSVPNSLRGQGPKKWNLPVSANSGRGCRCWIAQRSPASRQC